MFIVSLFGGIGSQIEQYAFSLALKHHYPDTRILYDINNIQKPDHNGFELDKAFGIVPDKAPIGMITALSDVYPYTARFSHLFNFISKIRRSIFGIKDSWIAPDDPSAFYPNVFKLNPLKAYIFNGNFGNDKYFEGLDEEIKKTFVFTEPEDSKNLELIKKIRHCNSASIHVRHGDYLKFGFPTMPLSYYQEAVRLLEQKYEDIQYFIFSDDIPYAKENFNFLKTFTIVDHNRGKDSFRDMQLMSCCKHNIIANSTFSYWGARLNENPSPTVIGQKYHVSWCKQFLTRKGWLVIDNKTLSND